MSKNVTRLFEQFKPDSYQLEIHIDDEAMTFSGHVAIKGQKTGRPSQRLTFHQKDLKITMAKLAKMDKNGESTDEIPVTRINTQDKFDEVRIHTDEMLYPGRYWVVLDFEGEITRPMNGIYPCFFEQDGVEKKLIATQFESHHAREAFPCIDEPEAKATFDLALVTPARENTTVIANTPARWSQEEDGKLTTIFELTPKMSTYLLAFVYGELGFTEATTKDGVLVRCYATPENVAHTAFALDVAVKCLEFYNEYFDVPYPLAKCDFIALPDFASGAMENWGCITFREQALLVDPQNTSLHLKQYVANVVAHELTHQWFGNLVTMRWWTDLWLNESFASWMSYLAIDHLFPEWHVWTQFIVEEQGVALKLDSLEHTHPIEVTVNHPDEIRTIFDAISYEKGASVLHMLHEHLGAEKYRDGMRLYLKRHAYSNTDTVDLWEALEEASGQPVREFMGAWTSQSGHPIITADVTHGTLHQDRFYLNPGADKESSTWPIPLHASSDIGVTTMTTTEQAITVPADAPPLVLNKGRTSFAHVVYDADHLEKLAALVRTGKLDDLDRAGLLSDSFEAAKGGYSSTVDALRLLETYADEDSTVVWDVISGGIGSMRNVMDDDEIRDSLKPLLRRLVAKQLKRLGWEQQDSDNHFDLLLRPTILGLASFAEVPEVVDEAKRRFTAMKKPEDVHPDLRGVIYGTVSRLGGVPEFEKLLKLHDSSKHSEERVTLSGSLTNFKQPELIDRALAHITTNNVRIQDAAYWVAYSFSNRFARRKTWEWMVNNWGWLQDNIGGDLSFFRMPNYAARGFSDVDFLPEFTEFFAKHMHPAFDRPVKQAIETIQLQAAWKHRDLEAIKDYLRDQSD